MSTHLAFPHCFGFFLIKKDDEPELSRLAVPHFSRQARISNDISICREMKSSEENPYPGDGRVAQVSGMQDSTTIWTPQCLL
jgi:hypothetical protein